MYLIHDAEMLCRKWAKYRIVLFDASHTPVEVWIDFHTLQTSLLYAKQIIFKIVDKQGRRKYVGFLIYRFTNHHSSIVMEKYYSNIDTKRDIIVNTIRHSPTTDKAKKFIAMYHLHNITTTIL